MAAYRRVYGFGLLRAVPRDQLRNPTLVSSIGLPLPYLALLISTRGRETGRSQRYLYIKDIWYQLARNGDRKNCLRR